MTPMEKPGVRRVTLFDRLARIIALLALVVILTVIYWIPLGLLQSELAVPAVLAILTLVLINMGSRLHSLRQRVEELQAAPEPEPPVDPPQK
jgi:hypothetical protein